MPNLRQKTAKAVLFALFIFFIIFSLVFMTIEANHECEGEGCVICLLIRTIHLNLKLLVILLITTVISNKLNKDNKKGSIRICSFFKQFSLISQKVQIND